MKNNMKKIPVSIILMFAVAAVLLVFSTVNGARAALTITSGEYDAEMQMKYIGITLVENGEDLNYRNYPNGTEKKKTDKAEMTLGMDDAFTFGTSYKEELAVKNSGTIDEYVRVTITKYWADEDGEKDTTLDPDLIDLKLANIGGSWVEDTKMKTKERTVIYYTNPIAPDEVTDPFTSEITVSNAVKTEVTQTQKKSPDNPNVTIITTTYDYGDKFFHVDVKVDGVQTHNSGDAFKSAWGTSKPAGVN